MNIGITTFQWANNYGALLQAHALQYFLQQRNHVVQIVDYRLNPARKGLRKWLAKTPWGFVRKLELVYKESIFESFRQRYLTRTSSVFYSVNALKSFSEEFDVLITGSDQVWNPKWLAQSNDLFDLYCLSFAAPKTSRLAYAASFGHSGKDSMTDEWQRILSKKLKEMDAISVREQSGTELIKSLCDRNDAVQVVDPTLLLDRKHYEQMAHPSNKRERYLFNYMLHGLEGDAERVCQQILESKDFRHIRCNAQKTGIHRGYTLPSPAGWLQKIRDASFMVTNSFHGVVFCLLFHTPFLAVLINGEIGSMNSRITELLNEVGLPHRVLYPQEKFKAGTVLSEEIPWDQIDSRLNHLRTASVAFLSEQGL